MALNLNLKKVIADIYPGQTQFYVIEFKCL